MRFPPEKWLLPPADLYLKGGEAHLWRIDLNQKFYAAQTALDLISADERKRAEKYYLERDRKNFIKARAALRQILSRYLDLAPHKIVFSADQYGKPALNMGNHSAPLNFNFSSSGEIALCAVTRQRKIGVDVELINPNWANTEVAERFFSTSENLDFKNVSETLRTRTFFSIWTRKEAFIKAVGCGLSYPLQNFSVSIEPDETTPKLTFNDSIGNDSWSLFSFSPQSEFAAALAVEGDLPDLRFWHWSKNSAG